MSTIDPKEIEHFSQLADKWWDECGPFKPLHDINPLRIEYIRDQAAGHFGESALRELELLDVGCGGGLICEPMARLGAKVTGIDAAEKNIGVATLHAEQQKLDIKYRCTSAETLAAEGAQYDIVLALEIVEHVADVEAFVTSLLTLLKPGGLLIMSTLNRTLKSYLFAIVGAEYVLRLLPVGTHHYDKFLRPSELAGHIHTGGGELKELMGMKLCLPQRTWRLTPDDLSVNYLLTATKSS